MAFDRQRAYEFSIHRDRDVAPFFAGRGKELRRFDDALRETYTSRGNQAVFCGYQGPPGCGKTSLVAHLRELHSGEALFVDVASRDFRTEDAPAERVSREIQNNRVDDDNVVSGFAQAGPPRPEPTQWDVKAVVLHMDEAQEVEPYAKTGLVQLHARGLGIPCVLVITGLGNTRERLSALGGLSRLSEQAIVNMGAMAQNECAESARMMLDALGAVGSDEEKAFAAGGVARLAYGWPQHLHIAQTALCSELLRTNGSLRDVDTGRVQEETIRRRHLCYESRLDGSVLGLDRHFTKRVIVKISEQSPPVVDELDDLCGEAMKQAGWSEKPRLAKITSIEFVDALVAKGVVTVSRSGCEVAIPSMVDWAADRDDPPSA
ncbi:MAG: ATP-binding protein [Gammaproteobacteria bacterium]|nr:ATP-binding protein [Gammaproteobacteria bacterium]